MKIFYILLIIVAVLAGISLIPGAVVIGLFLFVVPRVVLLASSTILVYMLAFLPGLLLYQRTGKRAIAATAAAACIAFVALAPGLLARDRFHAFAVPVLSRDFSKPPQIRPRSIELPLQFGAWQRPANLMHQDWPNANKLRPLCARLCQSLLFNTDIKAVYVTIPGPFSMATGRWLPSRIPWRFRLEHKDRCPDTLSRIAPAFEAREAAGECLIEERVEKADADVVIRIVRRTSRVYDAMASCWHHTSGRLWLLNGNNIKTIKVMERVDGRLDLVERRTDLAGFVAPLPFYVGAQSCGNLDFRLQIATAPEVIKTADIGTIIKRRYGLQWNTKAIAKHGEPSQSEHVLLLRILNRSYGPKEAVSASDSDFVQRILQRIVNTGQWQPADIAALRAAIRQPAFVGVVLFGPMRHHRDVVDALLPDLIARFAAPAPRTDNFRYQLDELIGLVPAAKLRPYKTRLAAILSDPSRANYAQQFIIRWGEIGDHPLPLLLRLIDASKEPMRGSAFKGLCRAITPSDTAVIEKLRAFVRAQKSIRYNVDFDPAILALLRAGRRHDVEQIAAQSKGAKASEIKWLIATYSDHPSLSACYR